MNCLVGVVEFNNVLVVWNWFALMSVVGHIINKYKNMGFRFDLSTKIALIQGRKNLSYYYCEKISGIELRKNMLSII